MDRTACHSSDIPHQDDSSVECWAIGAHGDEGCVYVQKLPAAINTNMNVQFIVPKLPFWGFSSPKLLGVEMTI